MKNKIAMKDEVETRFVIVEVHIVIVETRIIIAETRLAIGTFLSLT